MKTSITTAHLVAALLITVIIVFVCIAIQKDAPIGANSQLVRMAGLCWVICMSILFIHCGWMISAIKQNNK